MKNKSIALILFLAASGLIVFAIILGSFLPLKEFTASGGKVAVIPLDGEITGESADEVNGFLERAAEDPSIDAIVLHINSGGGTVVSTKKIVNKISSISDDYNKPIVAYIDEIGASGAYYAAAAADYIVADDDCITGSIGAVWFFSDINGLLSKLGVKVKVLKEGEFKSIGSPFHEMTIEEEKILQDMTKESFERFRNAVLSLRGSRIKKSDWDIVFDGRILLGSDAIKYGLVDQNGTIETAAKKALSLAGMDGKPELVRYESTRFGLLDFFFEAGNSFAGGALEAVNSTGGSLKYK